MRSIFLLAMNSLPLVVKLDKPIKVGGAWLTNEFGPDECLVPGED